MVTIALYNLKGGVGKTAASINLAYLSAKEGYKTLIWDLDPQGSSSFYLGVNASVKNEAKKILSNEMDLEDAIQHTSYENLDIIPADLSSRHADILLANMKQSKKKIASLLSTIKNNTTLFFWIALRVFPHCMMLFFKGQTGFLCRIFPQPCLSALSKQ